jgi:mannose-6-phosphate isomerase
MIRTHLYPLRFEPIYQLWGGRRLADLLNVLLPDEGPFGEAWVSVAA